MAVATNKQSKKKADLRARRRQARAAQKKKRQILYTSLAVIIASGVLALVAWSILSPKPGVHVASQGNTHITEAQMGQFTYNTSPPTSGAHLGELARWGVHSEPIPNELQVHNLEDGAVIVHYDCPDGCPDLVSQLAEVVERYADGVILEPYPNMETTIALTAWQRIDQFEEFDEERIVSFIRAYRGKDHHQ